MLTVVELRWAIAGAALCRACSSGTARLTWPCVLQCTTWSCSSSPLPHGTLLLGPAHMLSQYALQPVMGLTSFWVVQETPTRLRTS